MLKWFEMATRKRTAQHLDGEKGRVSQSVFLLTYGKSVRDGEGKNTPKCLEKLQRQVRIISCPGSSVMAC